MSSSRSNTLAVVTDTRDAHVVRHARRAAVSQLLRFDISLNLFLIHPTGEAAHAQGRDSRQ